MKDKACRFGIKLAPWFSSSQISAVWYPIKLFYWRLQNWRLLLWLAWRVWMLVLVAFFLHLISCIIAEDEPPKKESRKHHKRSKDHRKEKKEKRSRRDRKERSESPNVRPRSVVPVAVAIADQTDDLDLPEIDPWVARNLSLLLESVLCGNDDDDDDDMILYDSRYPCE